MQYISDALGFRVAATNLPGGHPQTVVTPQVQAAYLPYASDYQYYTAQNPVETVVQADVVQDTVVQQDAQGDVVQQTQVQETETVVQEDVVQGKTAVQVRAD